MALLQLIDSTRHHSGLDQFQQMRATILGDTMPTILKPHPCRLQHMEDAEQQGTQRPDCTDGSSLCSAVVCHDHFRALCSAAKERLSRKNILQKVQATLDCSFRLG